MKATVVYFAIMTFHHYGPTFSATSSTLGPFPTEEACVETLEYTKGWMRGTFDREESACIPANVMLPTKD